MSGKTRKAQVAGMFYPKNSLELKNDIQQYFSEASDLDIIPKALIVPHAGYVYSGSVAASGYVLLKKIKEKIKRVVLLGPAHRVAFRGLAATSLDAYTTPLGDLMIDKELQALAEELEQVRLLDPAHGPEHSLEVHLPFLQVVLDEFTLCPLVVGDASPQDVGEVVLKLWGGDETLFVISTDLSHFEDYETAKEIDAKTCRVIETLDENGFHQDDACGRIPVSGMLYAAKKKGLKIKTLDLRNSGDTAGSKDSVVGYGTWVLYN